SDSFRQYFVDVKDLPTRYATAIKGTPLKSGEVITTDLGQEFLYILPFDLPNRHSQAVVVHRFLPADDAGHTGPSLTTVALILLLLSLPMVGIVAIELFRSVARPIERLSTWAGTLASSEERTPQVTPTSRIDELNTLAAQLQKAIDELASANQREQYFLQTLSHELRTPLAVTGATLDLLDKKGADSLAAWRNPFDRLRRAHNDMRAMTEALLWLWRDKGDDVPTTSVMLRDLVERAWHDIYLRTGNHDVHVSMDIPPDLAIHTIPTMLQIMVHNLLRNALDHGAPGTIRVSADATHLHVSNAIHSDDATEEDPQGFGVGLYLVERIANRMAWKVSVTHTDDLFHVQVTFA
ncbi:MAG: HAMP domain-containing sensor histidine kinase, partial [Rhodanobacter sp.]